MKCFLIRLFTLVLLFLFFANAIAQIQNVAESTDILPNSFKVEVPEIIVAGVEFELSFAAEPNQRKVFQSSFIETSINGKAHVLNFQDGIAVMKYKVSSDIRELKIGFSSNTIIKEIHPIPLWMSILPPLLAIILALLIKEVITSLLCGLLGGTMIIAIYGNGISGIFKGLFLVIDNYILRALNDSGHLSVIIFSMLIGGVVAVISKNGGMHGVVLWLSKYAHDRRSGQFITWLLGVLIFFDDYANTLVVGSTMKQVTDKLKISREKLAYLVDSTAAPVAAIAFVTTWIGAELGYIQDGIESIPEIKRNFSVYALFFNSLQYSFYPIFTLIFMLALIFMKRDFGPMYKAELKANTPNDEDEMSEEQSEEMKLLEPLPGVKFRAFNAIIPIAILVFGTVAGLLVTGWDTEIWSDSSMGFFKRLSAIIGQADSYKALLWSSLTAALAAVLLTVTQKLASLAFTIQTLVNGIKTMVPAILILVMAWSLALVTEDLHTADFLTGIFTDRISPEFMPLVTFLLAAVVSFSTGSSWGTMAILYPLMLPSTWHICQQNAFGLAESMAIFNNVTACVLAGSVLGDHCSPISDTTILSSLASGCNHISHVKTQMPYALTVGIVSILFGTIPAAFGLPFYVSLLVGIAALIVVIKVIGRKIETVLT